MEPMHIDTPRLTLVAGDAALARAAMDDRERFAALLGAALDPQWPTPILAASLTYFADSLAGDPEMLGWVIWYVVLKEEPAGRVIGAVSFEGPPDEEGAVRLGYSFVPHEHGHGYAKEAVEALMGYAFAHGAKRVWAQISPGNQAAIRLMERCGMAYAGTGEGGRAVYERLAREGTRGEG